MIAKIDAIQQQNFEVMVFDLLHCDLSYRVHLSLMVIQWASILWLQQHLLHSTMQHSGDYHL